MNPEETLRQARFSSRVACGLHHKPNRTERRAAAQARKNAFLDLTKPIQWTNYVETYKGPRSRGRDQKRGTP